MSRHDGPPGERECGDCKDCREMDEMEEDAALTHPAVRAIRDALTTALDKIARLKSELAAERAPRCILADHEDRPHPHPDEDVRPPRAERGRVVQSLRRSAPQARRASEVGRGGVMNTTDYRNALTAVVFAAKMLEAHDLPALLQAIEHSESIGPMIDPTAWIKNGRNMAEDKAMFESALPLWGLAQKLVARASREPK